MKHGQTKIKLEVEFEDVE